MQVTVEHGQACPHLTFQPSLVELREGSTRGLDFSPGVSIRGLHLSPGVSIKGMYLSPVFQN